MPPASASNHSKYGPLQDDVQFVDVDAKLALTLRNLERKLTALKKQYANYSSYTLQHKTRIDMLCVFCANSLFWLYEKIKGSPKMTLDDIKKELHRVRATMMRFKEVHENISKRPRLDRPAVKRFINSALYDPHNPQDRESNIAHASHNGIESAQINNNLNDAPSKKKLKTGSVSTKSKVKQAKTKRTREF